MKVEAIPAEIAQEIGDVQALFDPRQPVKQNSGRSWPVSRSFIKPAQQPAAVRCKRYSLQTCFKLNHLLFSPPKNRPQRTRRITKDRINRISQTDCGK